MRRRRCKPGDDGSKLIIDYWYELLQGPERSGKYVHIPGTPPAKPWWPVSEVKVAVSRDQQLGRLMTNGMNSFAVQIIPASGSGALSTMGSTSALASGSRSASTLGFTSAVASGPDSTSAVGFTSVTGTTPALASTSAVASGSRSASGLGSTSALASGPGSATMPAMGSASAIDVEDEMSCLIQTKRPSLDFGTLWSCK